MSKQNMLKLREDSLDWALQHALKYGDTDVFPVPFEYHAIQHDWANLKQFLSQENVLEWDTRPYRALLAPKGRYGFRVVTQLDPLDFLLFAALVYEIGGDLESKRVSVDRSTVFSYRYSPDSEGRLFDPDIGYSAFQEECNRITGDNDITHVAMADIADFYQRIYHHSLENALLNASGQTCHVKAIRSLLSGWNYTQTYGIPVGKAPSRLLAEITISDIDDALLGYDIQFVRFNDDYRMFARSHSEGYRHLTCLANILYDNHGLTLQPQKTKVVPVKEFRENFLLTPENKEINALRKTFHELTIRLDLSDPYGEIDYEALDQEAKKIVDSLNLKKMFNREILKSNGPDLSIIGFILRRMGQLRDPSLVNNVFKYLDVLYPIFPDIIRYFAKLKGLSRKQRKKIGEQVLSLLATSIISELEYCRMWALELFAHSTKWDNKEQLLRQFHLSYDAASRRKLILALGRSSEVHLFRSRWRNWTNESPWAKRALIAGGSCMPHDARNHWYSSIESKLDPLEKAVMRWAKQNPFGQS